MAHGDCWCDQEPDEWIRSIVTHLEVSDETLALDLICEVGHKGDFLSMEHTLRRFRDNWYPNLFDRNHLEGWSTDGAKTLRQRSQERAEKILAEHRPAPLPLDVQRRIDQVLKHSWQGAPCRPQRNCRMLSDATEQEVQHLARGIIVPQWTV